MKQIKLVAHRGFAGEYPENSLSAFKAAVDCGCRYLELDVQVTKDGHAIVIHDTNLKRTGGQDVEVFYHHWSALKGLHIGEGDRFGDQYQKEELILLSDVVCLLQANPLVHAFVEIKEECLEQFGTKQVLAIVCQTIAPVEKQCSLISFDSKVLFEAKNKTAHSLGYVLHQYDESHLDTAKKLSPDILICNYKKIPDEDGSLWQGPWAWFLYEITDPELAKKWFQRGAEYIETMQIKPMINALK